MTPTKADGLDALKREYRGQPGDKCPDCGEIIDDFDHCGCKNIKD